MSVKAMSLAWEANIKPGAKLVLLAIADHADGSGICWPGQEHIAEKCGMNRSTVNQHIGYLVGNGFLFVEKSRSKTGQAVKAIYRVNMENPTFGNPTLETPKKPSKIQEPVLENPVLENPMLEKPMLENPMLENPMLEKPTLEKQLANVGKHNIPTLYESSMNHQSLCAASAEALHSVIKIPLNVSGTHHDVLETDVEKYSELYPAVDVMQQLRNMVGWCDANPSKRKTKSGIRRFINAWLSKKQDSGGDKHKSNPAGNHENPVPVYIPKDQRQSAFGSGDAINSTASRL